MPARFDWISQGARKTSPAPGYRNHADGALAGVGQGGYNWASTVSSTNGMYLSFYVTDLYPSNANHRAYGLPLRCLSE
ncbi:hypothetical protein [uncultured Rikenella sp.]|uniref:hypothetical protein n=1 Tax=uncultured Rikenella sp. TaxID=368003 RepID=UPI0025F0EB88|nr:hypothetical protein [uncultured Rikenella sp.]